MEESFTWVRPWYPSVRQDSDHSAPENHWFEPCTQEEGETWSILCSKCLVWLAAKLPMVPINILTVVLGSQHDWRGESQSPMRTPYCGWRTVASPLFNMCCATKVSARHQTERKCAGATGQMHSHTRDSGYNTKARGTQKLP